MTFTTALTNTRDEEDLNAPLATTQPTVNSHDTESSSDRVSLITGLETLTNEHPSVHSPITEQARTMVSENNSDIESPAFESKMPPSNSSNELDKESSTLSSTVLDQTIMALFDTFHPFPKLPIELRLKIWNEAEPEARVVEVEWAVECNAWFSPYASRHQPSGLLRACKESRELFLKNWSPLVPFSPVTELDAEGDPIHRGLPRRAMYPVSYFNCEMDTLYIGDTKSRLEYALNEHSVVALGGIKCLEKIRFLACAASTFYYGDIAEEEFDSAGIVDFTLGLHALESFTLVAGDSPWSLDKPKASFEGEIILVKAETDGEDNWRECFEYDFEADTWTAQRDLSEVLRRHSGSIKPHAEIAYIRRGAWTVDIIRNL